MLQPSSINLNRIDDGLKMHFIYAAILDVPTATGQVYSDLTGHFPVQSSKGNKYLLIVYDYNSNAILAKPMKNRTDAKML